MQPYRYINWTNGQIVLEGKDGKIQVELNRLSRYLFGEGASLNQVFNCGGGAFIKFQYKPEVNRRRVLLLTKIWRYCYKNEIKILHQHFKAKPEDAKEITDFNTIIKSIHEYLELHKS